MKEVKKEYFKRFTEDESAEPHVIKFYNEACHLCIELKEVFEKLIKELSSDYKFVKVNTHKEKALSDLFSPIGVPTIFIYKDNDFHEIKYPHEGYTYDYLKEVLTNEE